MATVCPQLPTLPASSVRAPACSFIDQLATGELLTGTPTVTELTTSDLTIGNVAVNTGALTIQGDTVAVGQAVQWSISGQQAGTTYRLKVSAGTDATPAQTLVAICSFTAEDDTV